MSTQTTTVSLDTDYLRSKQGLLRIAVAVISLCAVISVSQGNYCASLSIYSFYNFVVATTMILAIIILIVCMLGIHRMCTFINCNLTMLINDAIFGILYLIATILMITTIGSCTYGQVARIFATLFGIGGTIVLGLLALMGFRASREGSSIPKSDPA